MQYLKDEIKSKIMLAALKEFNDKGYLDASMRDIARQTGVASGNIYRYFKNKEELFNEVVSPAYNWFLLMQDHYNADIDNSNIALFEEIVEKIMEIAKDYKTQFLILIDKSKGTKHENFKKEFLLIAEKKLKVDIGYQLQEKGIEIANDFIFFILASTFLEGILIILRKCNEEEESRNLIRQLLILSFNDLANRFR